MEAVIQISQKWKQPKSLLKDEWLTKMVYLQTMDYDSALKRKEILTHATIWMKLEDITLTDINEYKGTNTIQFHLFQIAGVVHRDGK